ncbi:hypothetical protein DYB34_010295, partial [Aphanomyces astaci]
TSNASLVVGLVVAGLALAWSGTLVYLLVPHLQQDQEVRQAAAQHRHDAKTKDKKARERETSITNGEDVKMNDKQALVDVRISEIRPLLPPACLLEEIPRTVNIARTVNKGRQGVSNILRRVDDRLVVIVGPCSIHDVKAAIEYGRHLSFISAAVDVCGVAEKLKPVADELENDLLIIMRVYFEKPRTTVGWKGLINDPDIDGTFNINKVPRLYFMKLGRLVVTTMIRVGIAHCTGAFAGCEFLDTISPQFFSDLVSWGAIGARTTECQLHRELTSGLSMPVGFKNGTGGSLQLAVDAVVSAAHPHCFLSVSNQGLAAIVKTSVCACHVILRGGTTGTNYKKEHVDKVSALLKKANHAENVMVDCSHGNSNKNHNNQPLANQIAAGDTRIVGLMLESNLEPGAQKLNPGVPLVYGKSITDACIGWDETVTAPQPTCRNSDLYDVGDGSQKVGRRRPTTTKCQELGAALLDALLRWRMRSKNSAVVWRGASILTEPPAVSSYAQLVIRVSHSGEDVERNVCGLGEWLSLLELLTRQGVDALAFHRLVSPRDAAQCPLGDAWCSFCDGVDRCVDLELQTKRDISSSTEAETFLTVLRRAIFEWDDATASSEFHAVCDAVRCVLQAQETNSTSRRRAIQGDICLAFRTKVLWTGRCRYELQTLAVVVGDLTQVPQ